MPAGAACRNGTQGSSAAVSSLRGSTAAPPLQSAFSKVPLVLGNIGCIARGGSSPNQHERPARPPHPNHLPVQGSQIPPCAAGRRAAQACIVPPHAGRARAAGHPRQAAECEGRGNGSSGGRRRPATAASRQGVPAAIDPGSWPQPGAETPATVLRGCRKTAADTAPLPNPGALPAIAVHLT